MAAAAPLSPALLSRLQTWPALPSNLWYLVSGVTLSVLNRPQAVAEVIRHALVDDASQSSSTSAASQLAIARRMRESLLKASAIQGLPKTINALLALKQVTPPALLDDAMGYSASGRPVDVYDTPTSQVLYRGESFFDAIYGKMSARVMNQMDRSGTPDLGLTARLMYGYLLSNTRILSSVETSYILIAGLIPQDVNPQLKGHLKGALNNGAALEEVRAVRSLAIYLCELCGMQGLPVDAVHGWGWRTEVATV